MMPSPYTSEMSLVDARACAKALAVELHEVSISPAYDALSQSLAPCSRAGLQTPPKKTCSPEFGVSC